MPIVSEKGVQREVSKKIPKEKGRQKRGLNRIKRLLQREKAA